MWMMKTFSKRSMKLLPEIQTFISFSRSSSPINLTLTGPSYIHQLPMELPQQVFLLIVNDMSDYPSIFSLKYDTISLNVTNPPLVVFTRVCRLWRVVAHSSPEVWSRSLGKLNNGNHISSSVGLLALVGSPSPFALSTTSRPAALATGSTLGSHQWQTLNFSISFFLRATVGKRCS
ncbi:hypothetical protein BDR03DRAFT_395457 [Suillus americanus]|nr:hypothetical protein BDR03DRAFT_395457 [Suillus americanus]